jgi:serine/threonine protein kinase
VKRIRKPTAEEAQRDFPNWRAELNNLQSVRSEHVVSLVEFWEDSFCGYIAMEYCDGGNLRKAMTGRLSSGGSFSEEVCLLLVVT